LHQLGGKPKSKLQKDQGVSSLKKMNDTKQSKNKKLKVTGTTKETIILISFLKG